LTESTAKVQVQEFILVRDQVSEKRHCAQQRLAAAQDAWLAEVQEHGRDFLHIDVLKARKELELARKAYLAVLDNREPPETQK
jgi:hypothetical protein